MNCHNEIAQSGTNYQSNQPVVNWQDVHLVAFPISVKQLANLLRSASLIGAMSSPMHLTSSASMASASEGYFADGLKTQSEYRFLPGMSLGWTWDFLLPIKINDVLHVRFTVTGLRPSKSRPEWGIVVLKSELINQHDQVVQKGEHRLMIPRRAD